MLKYTRYKSIGKGGLSVTTKRLLVIILAACLTIGSVLMMFPGWMKTLFPTVDFEATKINFDNISIYNFPFYGTARQRALTPSGGGAPGGGLQEDGAQPPQAQAEGKYGISNIVESYAKYFNKQQAARPDLGAEFERITKQSGFGTAIYSLLMVALLTIPAYMVLRFLLFNSLYAMGKRMNGLFRMLWNGVVAICASVVTTFVTWFLYRSFLYELTFTIIFDWLKSLIDSTLALYSLGTAMTILVGFLVIWLIRATVFRGSVFTSLLGALMRTLLFILLIAIISVCIFELTLYAVGLILAGLLVIGAIKTIFLPEK